MYESVPVRCVMLIDSTFVKSAVNILGTTLSLGG